MTLKLWRRLLQKYRMRDRRLESDLTLTSVVIPPGVHIPASRERARYYRKVYVMNQRRRSASPAATTKRTGIKVVEMRLPGRDTRDRER